MKKTFALLVVCIVIGIASIPAIGMANNSEKSQTVTLKKKPVKIPDTPSNMDP